MKKILSIITIVSLVIVFCAPSVFAVKASLIANELLTMNETECVIFVKNQGVVIPSVYEDEFACGDFVKDIIAQVVSDPYICFVYDDPNLFKFAYEIKDAVNKYCGINYSTSVISNQTESYVLKDSTVVCEWDLRLMGFNCYAYSLGITIDDIELLENGALADQYQYWYLPGSLSGNDDYTPNTEVEDAVLLVEEDLRVYYNCVEVSTTLPSATYLSNRNLICFRKGDDFHFMKYSSEDDCWYHKPGDTQILRYNYIPTTSRIWTNECVRNNIARDFTTSYTGAIYFFAYSEEHTSTYCEPYDIYNHFVTCACGESLPSEPHDWQGANGDYSCYLCGYESSFIPVFPNTLTTSVRNALLNSTIEGKNNYSIFVDGMEFYYKDGQYYYVAEAGATSVPATILIDHEAQ